MSKGKSKIVPFLLNVVIGALSALAIVGYCATPFWKIKATARFNEQLRVKIEEAINGGSAREGGSAPEVGNDVASDILKQLAADQVEISLELSIDTKYVVQSMSSNDQTLVDQTLSKAIDSALDNEKIDGAIEAVTKSAAKGATKRVVRDAVEQFKNYPSLRLDSDVDKIMEDVGITDAYIDGAIDDLYDAFTSDLAPDAIADEHIKPIADDVYKKIADYVEQNDLNDGEPMPSEMPTEDWESARGEIVAVLEDLAVDGKVNITAALLEILSASLGSNSGETAENKRETAKNMRGDGLIACSSLEIGKVSYLRVSAAPSDGEVRSLSAAEETESPSASADAIEEIKTQLKESVLGSISTSTRGAIFLLMRVGGWVLVYSIVVWGYQLLKIIVNTLTGKMKTKMKLSIWSGWNPYLVLAFIPNLIVACLSGKITFMNGFLAKVIGASTFASLQTTMSSVVLSFSSSGLFAFLAAAIFVVIWLPYRLICKAS